jgi:hypothetical protein
MQPFEANPAEKRTRRKKHAHELLGIGSRDGKLALVEFAGTAFPPD